MWVEIIVAVIGVMGIIFTSYTSKRVAKITAKSEIQKLRETWAHEKETAIDAEFDKMVSSVSAYLICSSLEKAIEASQAISTYRAKAADNLAPAVDAMSNLFENPKQNYYQIRQALDCIVEIKRECSSLNCSNKDKTE